MLHRRFIARRAAGYPAYVPAGRGLASIVRCPSRGRNASRREYLEPSAHARTALAPASESARADATFGACGGATARRAPPACHPDEGRSRIKERRDLVCRDPSLLSAPTQRGCPMGCGARHPGVILTSGRISASGAVCSGVPRSFACGLRMTPSLCRSTQMTPFPCQSAEERRIAAFREIPSHCSNRHTPPPIQSSWWGYCR
jgi:hypothetical protein